MLSGIMIETAVNHLERLVKDKELWERLSKAAFQKVSTQFNVTKMVEEIEKLYLT